MNVKTKDNDIITKYPLKEFRNDYTIIDIIKMLNRHKNRKITDRLIENIQYEMKT